MAPTVRETRFSASLTAVPTPPSSRAAAPTTLIPRWCPTVRKMATRRFAISKRHLTTRCLNARVLARYFPVGARHGVPAGLRSNRVASTRVHKNGSATGTPQACPYDAMRKEDASTRIFFSHFSQLLNATCNTRVGNLKCVALLFFEEIFFHARPSQRPGARPLGDYRRRARSAPRRFWDRTGAFQRQFFAFHSR